MALHPYRERYEKAELVHPPNGVRFFIYHDALHGLEGICEDGYGWWMDSFKIRGVPEVSEMPDVSKTFLPSVYGYMKDLNL